MCFKTVFYIYWIVGIATFGVVVWAIGSPIAKKHPGWKNDRHRTFLQIPAGVLGIGIGMLIWGYGAKATSSAICGDHAAPPATSQERIDLMREGYIERCIAESRRDRIKEEEKLLEHYGEITPDIAADLDEIYGSPEITCRAVFDEPFPQPGASSSQ